MPANQPQLESGVGERSQKSLPGESSLDRTIDQSPADAERAQLLSKHLGPPAQVEGYDIQRCLGSGAFGTVWLATQRSTGKLVAIKFYQHRGGLDWALLNREVEKLAFLYTDRDIVQLIDVGWDASPPYYVMEYLERGSLEQLLHQGPLATSEAVRIVRDVAQALVHAHGRGILHCDLKPANVLLDNDWKVRLADFGQSRLSYEQLPALGTLFYMAPEQADLKASPDARWDVYALGALLFHLLTGSTPYRTPDLEARLRNSPSLPARLEEYRQAIERSPRPADHRRVRGVDRALAEIVDKCLEPDPARRFANAQAVLDSLDRRARHRARRPLIALGLVAPVLLLAATVGQGVIGWRAAVQQSETTLVRAVQAGNVYAAEGVASSVLLRLQKLSNAVQRTSEDKNIQELLKNRDPNGLHDFIEEVRNRYGRRGNGFATNGGKPPFESWAIMDRDGVLLARSPRKDDIVGRKYDYRDYYQGVFRQTDSADGDSTYISRVFRSEADQRYRFGITSPIRDGDETLGIVLATVPTGLSLGDLTLDDKRRMAVVVGRWDTNRADGPPVADKNLVLTHPEYPTDRVGEEIEAKLPAHDVNDEYKDPIMPGRWLAGFASVGNTAFVVIVQQRYDEATSPVKTLARTLAWRGWTALSCGMILLGLMWYIVQRLMSRGDRVEVAAGPHAAPILSSAGTELLSSSK